MDYCVRPKCTIAVIALMNTIYSTKMANQGPFYSVKMTSHFNLIPAACFLHFYWCRPSQICQFAFSEGPFTAHDLAASLSKTTCKGYCSANL